MQDRIDSILRETISALKSAIDVDSIIGKPIAAGDGNIVIPVSKISYGFISGGGEYGAESKQKDEAYPFTGGSGAGVTIKPIGFLVTGKSNSFVKIENEEENQWLELGKNVLKLLKK